MSKSGSRTQVEGDRERKHRDATFRSRRGTFLADGAWSACMWHVTCTITCAVWSERFVGSTANFLREIPHILSCFRRATRTPDCTKYRPLVDKSQKKFYFLWSTAHHTRARSLEIFEMQYAHRHRCWCTDESKAISPVTLNIAIHVCSISIIAFYLILLAVHNWYIYINFIL